MRIVPLSEQKIFAACELWTAACGSRMPYLPLSGEEFRQKFFAPGRSDTNFLLAAEDDAGALVGFILGGQKKDYLPGETFDNTPLYLTMLLVREDCTRRGVGSALLAALESAARRAGKTAVRVTYRNPTALSWRIPGTAGHTHNNAPGVDRESAAYPFLAHRGYREMQTECGMYLPLGQFALPEAYFSKLCALQAQQITVTWFDPAVHSGFTELFDALHGEVWRKTIRDNLALEHPLPVLVAVHESRIVGFAGPVDREPGGRGWFNGIATHPAYTRRGIAFVLFCRLMCEFQNLGAEYSTLFTDAANPAAGLYRSVGFRTVKQWAVMEKELPQ